MRIAPLALVLLAGCTATPEWTGRQNATVLMSENAGGRAAQEEWGFADAVVTGDTVYLSGIVAGMPPGKTDRAAMEAGYARAFEHIGGILKRAGADWDDVVDMISYHTDVNGQLDAMVAAKKRFLTGKPPAWTAIQVVRLIPDGGITEIKITAKLRKRK